MALATGRLLMSVVRDVGVGELLLQLLSVVCHEQLLVK